MWTHNTTELPFPDPLQEEKKGQDLKLEYKNKSNDYSVKNQVLVTLSGGFMHMYSSIVFTLPGMALAAMREGSDDLQLSSFQTALYGGGALAGATLGSLISGPMNVYFGQRKTLLWVHIAFIVFSIVVYFAQTFSILLMFTLLQGYTIGVASCSTMSYIVEVSHQNIRSRLTGSTALLRQFGYFFVVAVDSFGIGWRELGLICNLVTSIPPLFILPFMHDSPRWLASCGREEGCYTSLQFYRGEQYDVSVEYKEILDQLKKKKKTGTIRECKVLFGSLVRSRFLQLLVLAAALPMTGIISIASYIKIVLPSQSDDQESYLAAIVSMSMRVLGVLTFLLCADRLENKKICLVSLFISSCSTLTVGIHFLLVKLEYNSSVWAPTIATATFLYCICLANPILILIRGELLPTSARSTGLAVQNLLFHAAAFASNFIFPYMVQLDQLHSLMFFYSACSLLMFLTYLIFLPKTSGKTLEELNFFQKPEKTRF